MTRRSTIAASYVSSGSHGGLTCTGGFRRADDAHRVERALAEHRDGRAGVEHELERRAARVHRDVHAHRRVGDGEARDVVRLGDGHDVLRVDARPLGRHGVLAALLERPRGGVEAHLVHDGAAPRRRDGGRAGDVAPGDAVAHLDGVVLGDPLERGGVMRLAVHIHP